MLQLVEQREEALRAVCPVGHAIIRAAVFGLRKRVFADGDYVILHVHSTRDPGTAGTAFVEIFKLENGRIVEHWDVHQDMPAQAANTNTMF